MVKTARIARCWFLFLFVGSWAQAQQVTTTIEFSNLTFPAGLVLTDEFAHLGIVFSDDNSGLDPDFGCPALVGQENRVQDGFVFNLFRIDFVTQEPVTQVTVGFTDHRIGDQIHQLYQLDENLQIVQVATFDEDSDEQDFTLSLSDPGGIAGIAACEQPLGAERLRFISFTTSAANPSPDCAAAVASPARLWPPNKRLVSIAIEGVTDPDGDPVSITVTGIRQDEPLSRRDSADAAGVGTSQARVRSDRGGWGDGRVYHLAFEAVDSRGAVCTGEVIACVPHDQRPGATCGDGGALIDSTRP